MSVNKTYIETVKNKFSIEQFQSYLNSMKKLNVLIIGDIIIDYYVFVRPKGRAIKDPILSVEFEDREVYPGGVLAIANHIADMVNKIKVVSLIGDKNPMEDFIKKSVKSNIAFKLFTKVKSPTTIKKRMIDSYRKNKLFKLEYINDKPITQELSDEIVTYLNDEIDKYDLVMVGDFGHGFINDKIREKIQEKSKFLALNVQTNSANMGFNYINLYKKSDFITMDEQEIRLPLLRRFEQIDDVVVEAQQKFKLNKFLVTMGNRGIIFVDQGRTFKGPALTESIKDTVGAGDAVFSVASLFVYLGADSEIVPFISNCAGAIAVNIMGNKEGVTPDSLMQFVEKLYSTDKKDVKPEVNPK